MKNKTASPGKVGLSLCQQREIKGLLERARPGETFLSCLATDHARTGCGSLTALEALYEKKDTKVVQKLDLVAKSYKAHEGIFSWRVLEVLWEMGFQSPSDYLVPRFYGYSSKYGILVRERMKGRTWAECLEEDGGVCEASRKAALWLIKLQQTPSFGLSVCQQTESFELKRFTLALTSLYPEDGERFLKIAECLTSLLKVRSAYLVPSHGSYHPRDVLLDEQKVGVVNFDTFAFRDPEVDPGFAMSQLLMMSYLKFGKFGPGAKAALTFWEQYKEFGLATWHAVTIHVAFSFLQNLHQELCVRKTKSEGLVSPWLEMSEEWLGSNDESTLQSLIH